MASNCKEFNYLIDRKQVYTSNDIPSLIAYNKCLISEINTLNDHVDKLDDITQKFSEKFIGLEEKIKSNSDLQLEKIQTIDSVYKEKLQTIETTQQISIQSYSTMFEASKSMYTDLFTILGSIIAIAGLGAIIYINQYRKREIQKLVDDSLNEVKNKVDNENYLQGLVSEALKSTFIGAQLDSELEKIASAVELRVLNILSEREKSSSSSENKSTNQTTASALLSILKDD
ncbi:hypothetical protein [Photobacterium phosphoreum]|uniref:hypothetical protein n=1 Tax=Photobacterium phosphoreum TaxID=659 RepID=UPI0007F874BE|nr:hypothetical protein [Photobacterium phosphoreum]OBU36738.1 hypothetical protein AYY24_13720 [Photobacterium phosphoreum]PSW33829.1 hypothetical protein CTM87_18665 [Photobacterium phosphoreum]